MTHSLFIHSPVSGHLGYLGSVFDEERCYNILLQVFFVDLHFRFSWVRDSGIAGSGCFLKNRLESKG